MCTALSATIGTGNIVGVATAIKTAALVPYSDVFAAVPWYGNQIRRMLICCAKYRRTG
ncbi:alanine:cation symporter family protein [Vibrio lentus]|nr:alanine:cation symporter family protein [Vibrio lentus]